MMSTSGSHTTRIGIGIVISAAILLGCQSESTDVDGSIAAYRDRMLVQHQEDAARPADSRTRADRDRPTAHPVAGQSGLPERGALLTEPNTTEQPAPSDVLSEVPDPAEAADVFAQRVAVLRNENANRRDQRAVRNYERVVAQTLEYVDMLSLEQQVPLGLAECIQRAIEHNYAVRIDAYNPAISEAQIVEAEAAFDVEFYLDTSWAKQDQATASTFVPGTSDTRSIEGGFRKLLATGASVSVTMNQSRTKNNLPSEFQTMNPVYNTGFTASLQQPLLRGFGLDVTRSTINVRKVEHKISYETFIQKVRDTLLDVETAYWQLAQARRDVTIVATTVAQNFITYQNMKERLDHDATQVEVANSKSRWQSQYVRLLETIKIVRDAEDNLINLINDPALKLSDEQELLPTETLCVAPIMLDHFAEVRTALDRRSEIRAAKQQIEARRINTHVAKNGILPKLDLTFQYNVQGIGPSGDSSFDNLTTNRFNSYTLGAQFSYNFGERAARARLRQARLYESQAIVGLNQVTDAIVQEVNSRVRALMVRYEQIPPALVAVRAADHNLTSLQARTQRIDPNYLQTELGAMEQLANARRTLLQVLIEFNTGIVQLEKAKGTLLEYNNVTVSDAQSQR